MGARWEDPDDVAVVTDTSTWLLVLFLLLILAPLTLALS